jgi:GNAT superfamily N-acetyltransferase
VEIRAIKVEEFFDKSVSLLAAYANECRDRQLPQPKPDWPQYHTLQLSGLFTLFGAFDHYNNLVGFATLLVYPNPHYSVKLAVCESIFVENGARRQGAGLGLMRELQTVAEERGARALLFSAPLNSQFGEVLPAAGFKLASQSFVKALP